MNDLIPISHLSLDLAVPMTGWEAMLSARGVEIVLDDIGRPAIPRRVLGELIEERRAAEQKQLAEREARRAAIPPRQVARGIPASAVAPGTSALEVMMGYDRS